MKTIVRIESVTIKNFKNVKYGKLFFNNTPNKASVLGLYGQNGSGKTALIDAIALLQYALCGWEIPSLYAECINVDAEHAQLQFKLNIVDVKTNEIFHVLYDFCIKKVSSNDETNINDYQDTIKPFKVLVFNEILSYSQKCLNKRMIIQPVVDTRSGEIFSPKTKLDIFTSKNKEAETSLMAAKKVAYMMSSSFVFSKDFFDVIHKNCQDEFHLNILDALKNYGMSDLFVIDTKSSSGLISFNTLPLTVKFEINNAGAVGKIAIPLDRSMLIPEKVFQIVDEVVKNMNIVLPKIIPGLTIGIKRIGTQAMRDGSTGFNVQVFSFKNNKEIPFQYESEGIKKIVAILQLLIVVYNKPSITVAIDEMDSGIFEYLLGEILRIISERGKGQLIFTSHNLRPLETLNKKFVAFTTTNPLNRYIRLSHVQANNNLRDFYFRDILLGGQSESLYEQTNNGEIAFAFKQAGESYGA